MRPDSGLRTVQWDDLLPPQGAARSRPGRRRPARHLGLLPGPAPWDVVAEIGDGEVDDVAARVDSGVPPGPAAQSAIAEFGDPRQPAGAHAEELAATAAQRTGTALILTGPVVGLGWLLATAT